MLKDDFFEEKDKENKDDVATSAKDRTLADMFRDYNGTFKPKEVDWGMPVGKEL